MDELTSKELLQVIYLVRSRLRYESRRKGKIQDGIDLQMLKVRQLAEIADKLERKLNSQ